MKNILFRAKRKDTGEIVQGSVVKYGPDEGKYYIVPSYASALYGFEVEPETIRHFTESHDMGWIPVGERLPEAPGVYICFVRRNDPPVHDAQWEYRRNIIDCGDHYFETCTRWFSEVLGNRAIWSGYCEEVLAWMRLPEPYRSPGEKT